MMDSVESLDMRLQELSGVMMLVQEAMDYSGEKDKGRAFGHFAACVTNLRGELDDIGRGLVLVQGEMKEAATE